MCPYVCMSVRMYVMYCNVMSMRMYVCGCMQVCMHAYLCTGLCAYVCERARIRLHVSLSAKMKIVMIKSTWKDLKVSNNLCNVCLSFGIHLSSWLAFVCQYFHCLWLFCHCVMFWSCFKSCVFHFVVSVLSRFIIWKS